ncbi:hypothetical protein N9E09_01295 [bacterium]|nr:hypothetical protein [bacterium]
MSETNTKLQAWQELTDLRMQTSNWNLDASVTQETMQEIVDEIHRRTPCKQNQVHFGMHILDWSDTALRNEFYEMAVDRHNPETKHYNSQTLANWLVVFTGRIPSPLTYDYSERNQDLLYLSLSAMEIGLASHMLIYSAAARGLQCGFCRCLDFEYSGWDTTILPALGLDYPDEVQLVVGVGVASTNVDETYNLHTQQMVPAESKEQGNKWAVEPKPPQDEYVNWHV